MTPAAWGYAIAGALMMYLFFLIFLGLLALIPPLGRRFALRNVVAWLVAALLVGYLTASGSGTFAPLLIASALSAALAGLRYWNVMRKQKVAASSVGGQT